MTSKEALESLFNLLCEREHTNSEHCFWLKLYNTIEQDLEFFETLKKIEQEKKEAVKDFVEWYKNVLIKDYDDKANFVSINLEINDDKDFWYFTGQCTAIQRLIDLLDKDLENFIKETR